MDYHHHARLTVHGRELLCRQSAAKWVRRYREHGVDGLRDRSSRPLRLRRQEASERAEHRQKAELQYIEWQNTKRDVIFAERFTERELEVSIDAIVAEQSKKDPTLRRWSREAKRVYGRDSLWRELRASLGLPTFDEWLSDTAQASLF